MSKQRLVIRAGIKLDPLEFQKALSKGEVTGDLPARHKWSSSVSPYCVPNEYICGKIADFIGLPMPPFAITQTDLLRSKNVFSILDFNFDGRNLKPVWPEYCVKSLPELCAGVVAFDILTANADRHDKNLAVDDLSSPRAMQVFDHDVALFGWEEGEGASRLKALNGRLGITKGRISQGNRHCLLDAIQTTENFGVWTDRIWHIPRTFLETICRRAIEYGITPDEANAAIEFLDSRKIEVRGLIEKHSKEFKGVTTWKTV